MLTKTEHASNVIPWFEIARKNGVVIKYIDLDDDKRKITIELTEDSVKDCVEGHKVLVKVLKEVNKNKYIADVVKIIGHKADPGTDILTIAYKHGIYINETATSIVAPPIHKKASIVPRTPTHAIPERIAGLFSSQ